MRGNDSPDGDIDSIELLAFSIAQPSASEFVSLVVSVVGYICMTTASFLASLASTTRNTHTGPSAKSALFRWLLWHAGYAYVGEACVARRQGAVKK